jgi:hypothetical protein
MKKTNFTYNPTAQKCLLHIIWHVDLICLWNAGCKCICRELDVYTFCICNAGLEHHTQHSKSYSHYFL